MLDFWVHDLPPQHAGAFLADIPEHYSRGLRRQQGVLLLSRALPVVLMNDFGYSCFLVCASSFPVELLLAANAALNGLHPGKNSRVFFLYSLQGAGIESQRFQDCGSDLRGFN